VDAWSVPIHNLTGAGTGSGFVHHACRLFRRSRCDWVGRLHEQIAVRGTHGGVHQAVMEIASIRHTGYLSQMMVDRNKAERNLRVAEAEVAEADGWERGFSLTSLSRSYMTAGRYDDAYRRAEEALECSDNPITRRMAARTSIEALVAMGRLDEALDGVARLRLECTEALQADPTELGVRLARHDYAEALEILDRIEPGATDEDGLGYVAAALAAQRASALAGLGRSGEAADALIEALADDGALDAHLGTVIEHLNAAGRPLEELATAIPADKASLFLAQVLQLEPTTAADTLEACLAAMPNRTEVLAAGASLAKRLPVDRALVWSARLRAEGHAAACPLLAIAGSAGPAVLRARAAATALAAFGDGRAAPAFRAAVESASPSERDSIRLETTQLCPSLLDPPALAANGFDAAGVPSLAGRK
jgi:tetratricopeptide (TPR) repeat protein